MKEAIGIGATVFLAAISFWGVKKAKKNSIESNQVIIELINPYLDAIKNSDYQKAYSFAGSSYKKQWSVEDLANTYNERKKSWGDIQNWSCYKVSNENNIFTKEKLIQIFMHLNFEKKKKNILIEISDKDTRLINMTWEDLDTGSLRLVIF